MTVTRLWRRRRRRDVCIGIRGHSLQPFASPGNFGSCRVCRRRSLPHFCGVLCFCPRRLSLFTAASMSLRPAVFTARPMTAPHSRLCIARPSLSRKLSLPGELRCRTALLPFAYLAGTFSLGPSSCAARTLILLHCCASPLLSPLRSNGSASTQRYPAPYRCYHGPKLLAATQRLRPNCHSHLLEPSCGIFGPLVTAQTAARSSHPKFCSA